MANKTRITWRLTKGIEPARIELYKAAGQRCLPWETCLPNETDRYYRPSPRPTIPLWCCSVLRTNRIHSRISTGSPDHSPIFVNGDDSWATPANLHPSPASSQLFFFFFFHDPTLVCDMAKPAPGKHVACACGRLVLFIPSFLAERTRASEGLCLECMKCMEGSDRHVFFCFSAAIGDRSTRFYCRPV